MASPTTARQTFRKLVATTFSTDFRKACKVITAPFPSLSDNDVLLKNRYVGINATDINVSAGRYSPGEKPPLDVGLEGIGYAFEIGKNVPREIIGRAFGYIHNGAFAEYIKIPYKALLPLPRAEPTFVPFLISGLTAAISMDQFGGLNPGSIALITAAAGGTGHLAVQLANEKGCHVIATCSSQDKVHFLEHLGAHRVINVNEEILASVLKNEYTKGINFAYESIGGKVFQTCVDNLAVKGRIVCLGYISSYLSPSGIDRENKNTTLIHKLLMKSASVNGFFLFNHRNAYKTYLPQLLEMHEKGNLVPYIEMGSTKEKRFVGPESIFDAIEYLYSRKSKGKVVVDMQSSAASKL